VNVGILTEGWDSPKVDLILMCRPTKAPSLFVQMVGRGTRPFEGKKDLLILDLAENFKTHGSPSSPMVSVGTKKRFKRDSLDYKICPQCMEFVIINKDSCPICGFEFRKRLFEDEVYAQPAMRLLGNISEVMERSPVAKAMDPRFEDYENMDPDILYEIIREEIGEDLRRKKKEESLKDGNNKSDEGAEEKNTITSSVILKTQTRRRSFMAVMLINCIPGGCVKLWLDIEGNSSERGRHLAQLLWKKLSGGKTPPKTIKEAVERAKELKMPKEVTIVMKNGYKHIKEFSMF
jgi:hypothetical protein